MDSRDVVSDHPDFKNLSIRFYLAPVLNKDKTEGWTEEQYDYDTQQYKKIRHKGAGREIWEDAEFIEIRVPGNVAEVRCRQVRPSDKQKWPIAYAAFKAGQEAPVTGTPVERLPHLTGAQVLEFKSIGIRTAENIIAISDVDAQKFMGINKIKQQTADFLALMEGTAPVAAIRSELASRDAEIAALKAQMAELNKPRKRAE